MTVFISHSHKDQAVYETLCIAMDSRDIDRWDVSMMKPGSPLGVQLQEAISECSLCVFLATQTSIASKWCLAELGAFWGARKLVVIFLADSKLHKDSLPPQFSGHLTVSSPKSLFKVLRKEELESRGKSSPIPFTVIASRTALYKKCLDIMEESQEIRDTTWGRGSRKKSSAEQQAYDAYRKAIRGFVKSGKTYREVFSEKGREDAIAKARKRHAEHANYEPRILKTDLSRLTIPDMLIGDNCRLILSHVSARDTSQGIQFLYTESEEVTKLFLQFYTDCWGKSRPIRSRKKS